RPFLRFLSTPPPTPTLFPYTTLFRSLHMRDERPHPVGLAEARAPRVLAPLLVVADLDRPQIADALGVHQLDEMQPLVEVLDAVRSEEHTSELQSPDHLVCRLLLEKKK